MIVVLVFALVGLGLYLLKDKSGFYIYLMYLLYVMKFVITFFHISAPPASNYSLLLLMVVSVMPYINRYVPFVSKYLVVFVLYFVGKSVFSGMPLTSTLLSNIAPFILCLGGIGLYENYLRGRVNTKKILIHLYFIFAIQVIVCTLQYLVPAIGIGMSIESYEWRGITTTIKDFNTADSLNFVNCGLLMSNVTAAIFFSFTSMLLILYESVRKNRLTIMQLIVLMAGIPACVMTGIRAPLFILLAVLMVIVYRYERKYLIPSIVLMLAFFYIVNNVMVADDFSGLARIQEGFSILFSKDGGGLSDSTFGLSLMLVPFFLQNPLFGVSLGEYKTAMGYSIGGDGFSSSDAQLLYVLCEIGIIGLVIYLTPYFKYFKSLKVDRKKTGINLLLVAVLLLSIVDLGLFLTDIAYMFVIGIVLLVSVEGGTNFKLEKR